MFRVGNGYDVHQLVENRKLILGGVDITHEKGLLGHSDADVLLHAITDALLGACGEGDIGKLFPDNDPKYKNMDSKIFLKKAAEIVKQKGYKISNIDSIIVAQAPKISPYIDQIKQNIAQTLNIDLEYIGVKATTTEKLGFEGRKEGISSYAVACIYK